MSVIYKGAAIVRVPEYSFRADDGLHVISNARGVPTYVIAEANLRKNQGYDTYVFHDGPYSNLTATKTKAWPVAGINNIQLWGLATELVERSLFTLPGAIAEAVGFPADEGGRAGYKKIIEDAVNTKSTLDTVSVEFAPGAYPYAEAIYQEMMRGVQGYEQEYTVLTRTINYDALLPPTMVLKSQRIIYSTEELIALESPPATVMWQLPPTSGVTHPDQAYYGWRLREQHAEITNSTTGQQRTSWTYAAWSTFLYTRYDS